MEWISVYNKQKSNLLGTCASPLPISWLKHHIHSSGTEFYNSRRQPCCRALESGVCVWIPWCTAGCRELELGKEDVKNANVPGAERARVPLRYAHIPVVGGFGQHL